ncbi:hypothetical protein ABZT17_07820 [Streptomyces sp. NPDC005648]|uniref:hypothetical protein n=1 Tax=Streptomyces sp. NPDC005648 TaxID=3157044 RepID=UPI00339F50BE
MNDRNVEATEFLLELVSHRIIDPAAVSYTTDDMLAQWKKGKAAFGLYYAELPQRAGVADDDTLVALAGR